MMGLSVFVVQCLPGRPNTTIGFITHQEFRTERGYDFLTVNSNRYTGTAGPLEESMIAGGIIH
eukprot:2925916-Pyramimonas_sp.AAC.1